MSKRHKATRQVAPRPAEGAREPLPGAPRFALVAAAACGLFSLLVYWRTLCTTVYHGDSGEMIAAGATLGVAHPPGFPLHTMLAALFAALPLGSVAQRVNVLSS